MAALRHSKQIQSGYYTIASYLILVSNRDIISKVLNERDAYIMTFVDQSKLTTVAKSILKTCKQEMNEIQNCPTCYLKANTLSNWFIEACPKPHILVWAKLRGNSSTNETFKTNFTITGFPYWPGKVMSTNSAGMVDVRFFGAHDRAWIPAKDCYLYSQKDPNTNRQKKNDINKCIAVRNLNKSVLLIDPANGGTFQEVNEHVKKLIQTYDEFKYAPYKTPFNPDEELEQLKIFLPKYGSTSTEQKITVGDATVKETNENANGLNKSYTNIVEYEILDSDDECRLILEDEEEITTQVNTTKDKLPTQETKQIKMVSESPLTKTSRRNSTQSTHSDSSRFSTFSEKSIKINDDSNLSNQEMATVSRENINVDEREAIKSNKLHITNKIMEKLKDNMETMEKVKQIIGINSIHFASTNKRTYGEMSKKIKNVSPSLSLVINPQDNASVKDKRETCNDKDSIMADSNKSEDTEPSMKYIKLAEIKSIAIPLKKNESVLDKQLMTVKQNKAKAEKQKTPETVTEQSPEKSDTDVQIIPSASLENKKEIFLALNIQEKSNSDDKLPKQREIRTRSKTEEIYKSKGSSKSQLNGDGDSKTEDGTTTTTTTTTTITATPEIKQKARKSFPRPGDTTNKDLANIVKLSVNLKPTTATTQANISKKSVISAIPAIVASSTKMTLVTTTSNPVNLSNTSIPTQSIARPLPALVYSNQSNKDDTQKIVQNEMHIPTTTIISKPISNQSPLNNHILSMLTSLGPSSHVDKGAINNMCRSPPPITPKPQSILTTDYDDNVPSSAGPVTERINSVAYRVGIQFLNSNNRTIYCKS